MGYCPQYDGLIGTALDELLHVSIISTQRLM
jgi:hypothetical protein